MKRFINVHKGEATAGRGEVVLKSDVRDRSCFAIVARDPMHKIGAIAHAMFLHSEHKEKTDPILVKDARESIDKMISNMTLLGATSDDIEVSLVAGENVEHQENDPEYDEEINRIFNILKERQIRCKEDSVVDAGHKHVALDVETGNILYT